MIKSLGFLPNEDDEMEVNDNVTLYLVFSTDCSPSQHWESYLLFFSAMRAKQLGIITRIASGCTEKQTAEAREFHQLVSSLMIVCILFTCHGTKTSPFADFFVTAHRRDVKQVPHILHA